MIKQQYGMFFMVTNYDQRAFSINIFSEAGGGAPAKC